MAFWNQNGEHKKELFKSVWDIKKLQTHVHDAEDTQEASVEIFERAVGGQKAIFGQTADKNFVSA